MWFAKDILCQSKKPCKYRIRGHQYKLFKRPAVSWFLSARAVDSWNKLKAQTLEDRTVEEFKIARRLLNMKFIRSRSSRQETILKDRYNLLS